MPRMRIRLWIGLLLTSLSLPLAAEEESGTYDPFEPLNRKIFVFNEGLDEYILEPVARGYRNVTPDPVERGVSNFISNLVDFNNIVNSILQGRVGDAIHSTGRFLANTTIGLGGLFDVASQMGVEQRSADFGQTLATWGVGQGPFLMVPVLGPRTLRSGVGTGVDVYISLPYQSDDSYISWGYTVVEAIDLRAQLLGADELISGDRYIFFRDAYIQRRQYLLSGGVIDDTFSDFEDEEDYEEF